ncbi:hypothetical protein L1987_25519 [Smallanthus sonchifolius]|uniref:Uncharacterized protein n=1 Tax=Smallanthus sonchifolius TaxID=185202 RepID=A0ACB9IN84_9ASTR|nr:hypothetical protein L1987_25519 [Smallanthus sonchifolius]
MELAKLLYIVVEDDCGGHGNEELSFRYTRHVLDNTLQLMGCKARHAFKNTIKCMSSREGELILFIFFRIRERKESVTVLLCGTSGYSEHSKLNMQASRLRITTVVSTDSIRRTSRSSGCFRSKIQKKFKNAPFDASTSLPLPHEGLTTVDLISPKQMAIEGFKAQSEMGRKKRISGR